MFRFSDLRDAQGILASLSPSEVYTAGNVHVQLWDGEGFTSLENCLWPLHVVRCLETRTVRRRIAGQWVSHTESHEQDTPVLCTDNPFHFPLFTHPNLPVESPKYPLQPVNPAIPSPNPSFQQLVAESLKKG